MSLENLPEKVRQSSLTQVLDAKLSSPLCADFDYWGEFKRLRDLVSAQVGEMKTVFPLFTPHDEEHHLSRIFGIADKMLGRERYARMNAAELFLLASGLYAHDWGMAVSQDELKYLRLGATGTYNSDAFTPLDDERFRLHEFAERQGLRPTNLDDFPELEANQLCAYIRYTHAWRSGVRVRTFFKSAGASLPQAMERVCQGHWLDFPELDDESRFPVQFGVLGQTVNLRAIALYVRLVDLFDIADDRTPYAIWRFVAPRDPRATMEWSKHRALSPVTFPVYGDGRSVRFDGSTSDPEVWAELEDLHTYCETQLFGAIDLMARHHDERHQLDLRKIEWAVTAERFKPVNIRFEFQRQRMFEILADEIYRGDSHVFLRELLQNSIDAIRMRREMVKRRAESSGSHRDIGLGFDDAIYYSVEHGVDGDAVVRCRDYGIGMDEYVIRNYLAVAGASYYQSDEFRHIGLSMDPISRFGIGILSCFMVADRLEIETSREPHLSAEGRPLRIEIPSPNHQFRIFAAPASTDVGTVVTVHVCGAKLKTDVLREEAEDESEVESSATPRLQVTEYLAAIAGFVEFPIVIDEDGQRTVILHPDRPESDAREFFRDGGEKSVRQLSNNYPWDEAFVPQDADNAARFLHAHVLDLHGDLDLADCEGTLCYLRPTDDPSRCTRFFGDGQVGKLNVSHANGATREVLTLRLKNYSGHHGVNKFGIALSGTACTEISVYREGILLPDIPYPIRYMPYPYVYSGPPLPLPILKINLSKRLAGDTDVARRTFRQNKECWDGPVWRKVVNYLRKNEFFPILGLEPLARLKRFALLASVYRLSVEELIELVPRELCPGLMLISGGQSVICDLPLMPGQSLLQVPVELVEAIATQHSWGYWDENNAQHPLLKYWTGDDAIVFNGQGKLRDHETLWLSFAEQRLQRETTHIAAKFLRPPLPGLAPLTQLEHVSVDSVIIDKPGLFRAAMMDPLRLNPSQFCALRRQSKTSRLINATPFAAPFENCFAYGKDHLNLNHPTVCALFRCAAALKLHRPSKTMPSLTLAKIDDALNEIVMKLDSPTILGDKLTELWALVKESGLVELHETPPSPTTSDYVWGSLDPSREKYFYGLDKLHPTLERYLRPFGQILTDSNPEELPPDLAIFLDPKETMIEIGKKLGIPEYCSEGT
jgi:hypothetical protein